jgi:hypothetical protein
MAAPLDPKRFYDRCAALLGVPHEYRPFPFSGRSRWNNRAPGSGRFPGRGLIRLFGQRVHVSLHQPVPINRWFESPDEAVRFLEKKLASG